MHITNLVLLVARIPAHPGLRTDATIIDISAYLLVRNQRKYIMAPRNQIISADFILCMQSVGDVIYETPVSIIYHVAEYNLAILATTDKPNYQIASKISSYRYDCNLCNDSTYCAGAAFQFDTLVHHKTSICSYAVAIVSDSYLIPGRYVVAIVDHDITSVLGTVICNGNTVHGMIVWHSCASEITSVDFDGYNCYLALPISTMYHILQIYQKDCHYKLSEVPFTYHVDGDRLIASKRAILKSSTTKSKYLEQGDWITSINGLQIIIDNNAPLVVGVYDTDHLISYIKLHCCNHTIITVVRQNRHNIASTEKILQFDIYPDNIGLPYTNLPLTCGGMLPYHDLHGIIVIPVTHELLLVLMTLNYPFLDRLLAADINVPNVWVIIDSSISGYDLPQIATNRGTISRLKLVNGIPIESLTSIPDLPLQLHLYHYINNKSSKTRLLEITR